MARLRSTASSQQPTKTATASRQALKEKTNTSRAKAPVHQYEDDGNTEGLVKEKQTKRGRPRKITQESDDLMMAGALGHGSNEDATQPPSERPMTTDELAKSDDAPPATAKPNRRPPRTVKKVVQSEAQTKVMESLKQRMEQTARGQRAKQAAPPVSTDTVTASSDALVAKATSPKNVQSAVVERSEFSLSPSPPPAGKLSAVKGPRSSMAIPGSVLKAQNTPAHEVSILALKNFKRRPRQPSMLQMVQQRTASARPSLANTAVENTAVEDSSVFDLGLSDEGEDDFAPEAEGTPLHASKTRRISTASGRQPASAESARTRTLSKTATKKRKSDDANLSSGALSALKAKRRRSTAVAQEEQEDFDTAVDQQAGHQSSPERAETPQPPVTSDVQVINSPSTSTPPTDPPSSSRYHTAKEDDFVIPSTEREDAEAPQDTDPDDDDEAQVGNDTVAEPLSSSPAQQNAIPTTDELADPLTQLSEKIVTPKPKRKSKPVFTQHLQSLLPKRRQPLRPRGRRSEYDIDSETDDDTPLDVSHLGEDEDELGNSVRRKKKPAPAKAPKSTGAKRGRPSKATSTAGRKSNLAPRRGTSAVPAAKTGPKTYGRAAASDKENEGYESPDEDEEESTLPEVSVSMQEVVKSRELEEARKKFADVDDWDMEFESMSQEFHRSSSQEWR